MQKLKIMDQVYRNIVIIKEKMQKFAKNEENLEIAALLMKIYDGYQDLETKYHALADNQGVLLNDPNVCCKKSELIKIHFLKFFKLNPGQIAELIIKEIHCNILKNTKLLNNSKNEPDIYEFIKTIIFFEDEKIKELSNHIK